jgi:hypothetical protein
MRVTLKTLGAETFSSMRLNLDDRPFALESVHPHRQPRVWRVAAKECQHIPSHHWTGRATSAYPGEVKRFPSPEARLGTASSLDLPKAYSRLIRRTAELRDLHWMQRFLGEKLGASYSLPSDRVLVSERFHTL